EIFELASCIGLRPETTDCAPYEQVSQNPEAEIYQKLKKRALDILFVKRRELIIFVLSVEALWLPDEHAHGCEVSFMTGSEFANVHSVYYGSMHLILPR
ncbi:MAG: hypothetical protein K8F25_19445, partial [Fimbriimonadaceae bacterium]|nr:hypothetical protein [Alphaproteobacteria bacterium]